MFDRLDDILIHYEEVMQELNEPNVTENQTRFRKLMKEQADLAPIVEAYKAYKQAKQDIEDSLALLEALMTWMPPTYSTRAAFISLPERR